MSYATYNRLKLRVSASDVDVVRAAAKRIAKEGRRNRALREARKRFYREALHWHHNAQALVRHWRLL